MPSSSPRNLMAAAAVALGCTLVGVPAQAADPGAVPEGVYTLMKISGGSLINLGTLEIKGKTYRFADEGSFAPFTLSGNKITWTAGLNIMPEGWKLGQSVYTGLDQFGRPMIKINYMSPRNAAEVIDCVKEK